MRKNIFFLGLMACFTALLYTCTPKVVEPITKPDVPVAPTPDVELSPCPSFADAPNPDDAETNYVLYRDFLKAGDYEKSYDYWKKVYALTPAADGQRNTVFSDGIFFYEYFMSETNDSSYIDSIFTLYDNLEKCFPQGGYVAGRKGYDYYYNYPNRKSKIEIYELFKESIAIDKFGTNNFVIVPFAELMTELHDSMLISDDEARLYDTKIKEIIRYGKENCKGDYCDDWKVVEEYGLARLGYFETIKGFYDCDYYIYKYYPLFEANPDSCDVVNDVMSRLAWGGCMEGNAKFDEVKAASEGSCRIVEHGLAGEGYECLKIGDYDCAIDKFKQAADEEDGLERKSAITFLIAKIYYVHKRNFSAARRYALQAADMRPGWGAPYILIGRMYASSGPLCGPGRGWDSQIVVWTAIDMWNKAKQVDPSSAAEARKMINQYSQYMPKKEDLFFRGLDAGDSYFVPCWIQSSTRIRTSD